MSKSKIGQRHKKRGYKETLRHLQIELVKLQRHLIRNNLRILIVFEGRDAAGKDGVIKRITQHLSPRDVRIVALGKPSSRDRNSWYFQRYVQHLPSSQEMVLMNRSWYNRAGVEQVMNYCNDTEYESFMSSVPLFEDMLIQSGTQLFKYYLDITKAEQEQRLTDRRVNPLKQWKVSDVDQVAVEHWNDYSLARNKMFARTHTLNAPWYVVQSDNKKKARLNVIRHILSSVDCPDKDQHMPAADPQLIFAYDEKHLKSGAIAP